MTTRKLQTLLGDRVIASDGRKVEVETLQGKILLLYFAAGSSEAIVESPVEPCKRFTRELIQVYEKANREAYVLEVVFVSKDISQTFFEAHYKEMPWLALAWDSRKRTSLYKDLKVEELPTLVVFDKQGNLWSYDACNLVYEHGAQAFTTESMSHSRTLEKVLIGSTLINRELNEVEFTVLKGKAVGLFFSSQSSRAARSFTHKLVSIYQELKSSKYEEHEVVFISNDHDQDSFNSYFTTMPWLAVSFDDRRTRSSLMARFNVPSIPYFIIFDHDGEVVTREGCSAVEKHGSNAFTIKNLVQDNSAYESDSLHPSGTHITIYGSGDNRGICSVCKRSRDVCNSCSSKECNRTSTYYGGQEKGIQRGTPNIKESLLSKFLGQVLGPEVRGTLMAGMVTAILGAVTYCCSKFGAAAT